MKIEYEMLDSFTSENDLEGAKAAGRTVKGGGKALTVEEPGDDEKDTDAFVAKEKPVFEGN